MNDQTRRVQRETAMTSPMKRMQLVVIAAVLVSLMPVTAFAGTITLRSAVRLPADATQVRLMDIAELSGSEAERFKEVIVAELSDPTAAVEISLRQVREALEESGVHWGRVSLSGRSVTVRPRRSGVAAPPVAMGSAAVAGALAQRRIVDDGPRHVLASELIGGRTLRSQVAAYLASGLKSGPENLQLSFDERHAAFFDSEPGNARYEIEPVSNLNSSRIDLTIRVWVDGLIDHRRTVSVSPLVRTPVVVVREEIRRDEEISDHSVRLEHRWLSPSQPDFVRSVAEVTGRHALVRLREGEVLRNTHLRRETLIRRGEHVTVRCMVGSAVISLQAEARADGSEGDVIEFRKLGEREVFLATVTGRNEAILDLSKR